MAAAAHDTRRLHRPRGRPGWSCPPGPSTAARVIVDGTRIAGGAAAEGARARWT